MELTQYILLVLLSIQPAYSDGETWRERETRMQVVAASIATVSNEATCTLTEEVAPQDCKRIWPGSPKELATILVAKAWWESKLAKNVHEDKCESYQCDPYKKKDGTVGHRARSIWQVQKTSFVRGTEWNEMKGSSLVATTAAARVAARALSSAYSWCGSVYGAFSGYGGTIGCKSKLVANRYRWWVKVKDSPIDLLEQSKLTQQKSLELRLGAKSEKVTVF